MSKRKRTYLTKAIEKSVRDYHVKMASTVINPVDFVWIDSDEHTAFHVWNGERHYIRIAKEVPSVLDIKEDAKNLPLLYKRIYAHEMGHAYGSTKNKRLLWKLLKEYEVPHQLWNLGEDVRIEHMLKEAKIVSSWNWTKWIPLPEKIGKRDVDAVNILLGMKMIGTNQGGKIFKEYIAKLLRDGITRRDLQTIYNTYNSLRFRCYREGVGVDEEPTAGSTLGTWMHVLPIMKNFMTVFGITASTQMPKVDIEFSEDDKKEPSGGGGGGSSKENPRTKSGLGGSGDLAPEHDGEVNVPIVDLSMLEEEDDNEFVELTPSEIPCTGSDKTQNRAMFYRHPANPFQVGDGDEIKNDLKRIFEGKGTSVIAPTMDITEEFDMLDAINRRQEAYREATGGDYNPHVVVILDCSGSMNGVFAPPGKRLTNHALESLRMVSALNSLHREGACRFDLLLSGQGPGIHWPGGFNNQVLRMLRFWCGHESIQATMVKHQDLLVKADIVIALTDGQISDMSVDRDAFEAVGISVVGAYACRTDSPNRYNSCINRLNSHFGQCIVRDSMEDIAADIADSLM